MATRPVKLKLLPRSVMKAKSATRLVGQILAGDGISIAKAAGIWTISVNFDGISILTGPASSTDNAVPRFDGVGGTILQNSNVLISDAGLMTVSMNAAALPTPATGTVLHLGNADELTARVSIASFGTLGVPNVTFHKSRGNAASPTAVQSGNALGSLTWNARGATAYASSGRALFQGVATENWTDSAQGMKLEVYTTPTGGTATAKVVDIGAGGTLTLTPTANTTNRGVSIEQSSQTTGSVEGPIDFNRFEVNNAVRLTAPAVSVETPWNDRAASVLKLRQNVGANATGFQVPLIVEIRHETETDLWADGSCDFVGITTHVYSNAQDNGALGAGAGLFGTAFGVFAGPNAVHGDCVAQNPTCITENGATLHNVIGNRSQRTGGPAGAPGAHGSVLDAAYTVCGFNCAWDHAFVLGDDIAGFQAPITGDIIRAHFAFGCTNFFNLSNVTASGSFAKFDNKIDWVGTGQLNFTLNAASVTHGIRILNQNTGGVASVLIENDLEASNLLDVGVRGSARAAFGDLVGSNAYALANGATGLMLMASHASGPVRFASGGNTERARFTPSGGLNLGGTADVALGGLTMSGALTITKTGGSTNAGVQLVAATPAVSFTASGAATDEKNWDFFANAAGTFNARAYNDAGSVLTTWLTVDRTGTTIDVVALPNSGLNVGASAATAAGVINANSGFTVGTKPMGQVLLNTLTASNSATLDDTTSITSAYDLYFIEVENVVPVSNAVHLMMQFSKDGGGAWLATGYLNSAGAATDSVWLNNNVAIDNTAGAGLTTFYYVMGPNRTDNKKMIVATGMCPVAGVAANAAGRGWYNTDNDAVNAMRFKMDSGNISTGKIRIYGIRTS